MQQCLVFALAQLAHGQDNAADRGTTFTTAAASIRPSTVSDYELHRGKNAHQQNHGAIDIDTDDTAPLGLSVDGCKARCDNDLECDCVSFRHSIFGQTQCFKRKNCVPAKLGIDLRYNTYIKVTTTTTTSISTTSTVDPLPDYTVYPGERAYQDRDHGAVDIDDDATAPSGLSADECKARCSEDPRCDCVTFQVAMGTCWKRAACNTTKFESDAGYGTFVKVPAAPVPTASPSDGSTTTVTTTTSESQQQQGAWFIPVISSLSAVMLVAVFGGYWYGGREPVLRAHREPLVEADPEACLPDKEKEEDSLSTASGTSMHASAEESTPRSQSSRAPVVPASDAQAVDEKVGITARVEDEMIYFRVPGAATATVAGEWAWPGTALWHAVTAAPRHSDGTWELGPLQRQLSPDFRVTVDGLLLQTSTQEALAQ